MVGVGGLLMRITRLPGATAVGIILRAIAIGVSLSLIIGLGRVLDVSSAVSLGVTASVTRVRRHRDAPSRGILPAIAGSVAIAATVAIVAAVAATIF
jgi:hypothetical protein